MIEFLCSDQSDDITIIEAPVEIVEVIDISSEER